MLIKVNSRMWENFNCVNSLSLQRCIRGTGKDVYIVNLCDEWERQYCCELCRYYGGGDKMECDHCDPMNI